jgi:hypothetical protein
VTRSIVPNAKFATGMPMTMTVARPATTLSV